MNLFSKIIEINKYVLLCDHTHELKGEQYEIAKMVAVPNSQEKKSPDVTEVFVSEPFESFEDVTVNKINW